MQSKTAVLDTHIDAPPLVHSWLQRAQIIGYFLIETWDLKYLHHHKVPPHHGL